MARIRQSVWLHASFFCVLLLLSGTARSAKGDSSLPIPTSITVEQDDRNAILVWNGGILFRGVSEPAGVAGYRVAWGLEGQPLTNIKLVTERTIQLQPLVEGLTYEAQIQTVDVMGHLSTPSSKVTFHSDPARVSLLRWQMNGFFDDFNRMAGALDERKWNTAYSVCNDTAVNGAFINGQFHAHNMAGNRNGYGDRIQVVNRPRAAFDFTNRVGTLVFDMDGAFRRDHWYLDMVPTPLDITGQVSAGGQYSAHPGDYIRIAQAGQGVGISYMDAKGVETEIASTAPSNPYPRPDYTNYKFINNVRRHWVIHFSRTGAEILINGNVALRASFQLNYSRVTPLWVQLAYNPMKANEPVTMLHWDNFGFDASPVAPTAASVTHNYKLVNDGTDYALVTASNPVTERLLVPDSIARARAVRFLFTLQMRGYVAYRWDANDSVTINGMRFAIPEPGSSTGLPSSQLVDFYHPYSVSLAIPRGVFQQGNNTLVFSAKCSGVLNIHAEFDFPPGAETPYTQASQNALGCAMPALQDIGPAATVVGIGDKKNLWNTINGTYTVSGVTPIDALVTNDLALIGNGSNPGISRVELLIDGQVIATQATDAECPAPSVFWTFSLDTHQFANGPHLLYIRAYNPTGVDSYPDYEAHFANKDITAGSVPIVIAN